jgi:hypothetical protein
MRGVHRLYANGRMQIFCLMILFMALESLAVINLTGVEMNWTVF